MNLFRIAHIHAQVPGKGSRAIENQLARVAKDEVHALGDSFFLFW
jgi:hypothetical protein